MKIVLGRLILGGTLELEGPSPAVGVRPATVGPRGGIRVRYQA
jgi:hypothetical protein